jgi:Zn-dependent protease
LLTLHKKSWFNSEDFWFAMAIVAPTILLHEFGHKFIAIAFGAHATFQAAYTWLGLGVILKFLNFGFLFFVPAFVSISGNITSLQSSLIAFAGPFMNLIIWLSSMYLLKTRKFSVNVTHALKILSYVNKYLFIFNMLPIPLFDGFKVYTGLFHAFF